MTTTKGFEKVVSERPWIARGMLVVCGFSLLATGPVDGPNSNQRYTAVSDAPTCNLTAESPLCDFLVRVTHDSPAEVFVTTNASASIGGSIVAEGVTGDRPFVAVHVASEDQPGSNDLSALTEFSVTRTLNFSGGCEQDSTAGACSSEFTISFQRSDLGDRGGTVRVNWGLELEGSATFGADAGAGALPWTVEYIER
jgi:hypothetical protein